MVFTHTKNVDIDSFFKPGSGSDRILIHNICCNVLNYWLQIPVPVKYLKVEKKLTGTPRLGRKVPVLDI
jgi:hypothetical protein